MDKLTHQEEELMLCIWKLESCTVKEAMELMDNPAPYTTVASVAKNLERKGYVSARKVGNTYLYSPAVKQTDYKRTYLGRNSERIFPQLLQRAGELLRQGAETHRRRPQGYHRHY